jgi:GT2 family glycosyltransferase/glycosyltransferase involved in cell wall biosynthesis
LRTTLNIQDPLFISAPNGGGIMYAHRHLLIPLIHEDATGLSTMSDGLLWSVQTAGAPTFRRILQGQFGAIELGATPLDLHDVLVHESGTYAVFTQTNQVVKLGDDFTVEQSWSFGDEPDCAHVNCIAMYQGRLICSLFGAFATHRGYKNQTRKSGRVIDVQTGELLIDGLSQPHSLVVAGPQLWLCSSEDCSVHCYDQRFQLLQDVKLPGYTRGLALGESVIYVGLSRSRNLRSGQAGEFSSAVVALLDRESLSVIGYMPIHWNEIYDIKIAPSAEVVADAMASSWVYERTLHQAEVKDLQGEWSKTQAEHQAEVKDLQGEWSKTQAELADREKDLALARESALAQQALLSAKQIENRGEIVKREARIQLLEHVLEQAHAELALIKSSRSWRWTRLIRVIQRTIKNRGLSPEDRRRLLGLPAASVAGTPGDQRMVTSPHVWSLPTDILPAPQAEARRDFFFWAVIDWHFRIQRPQQLARELAVAGHRVFYVSNHFIDRAEPGFSVETLDNDRRLFQIHLHLQASPAIYHAAPSAAAQAQLSAGICLLLAWTKSVACASLIQHPYWMETAQALPNQRVVYDCMDHHGGFADNADDVLAREHELMREADLLVVTSDWLYEEAGKYNPRRTIIRNACQYEHFANAPAKIFKDAQGRKVIGYYGAIAEWFDLDLIEKVARRFSDCLLLLVGADTSGAQRRLQSLDNVAFTGEVPYADLPYYLEGFDVCLLPFQVIPLTLATNPVKVYEYLSAGKEVVCIDLPEIRQFGDLVRTGDDHTSFIEAVAAALAHPADLSAVADRRSFAAAQTWAHRVRDLVGAIDDLVQPRVSVIVVTYNNIELTKACLDSVERYSDYTNLEVIVVDNASVDGTPDYLQEWAAKADGRQVILNPDNRGFAAANNQGLMQASGDYLIMLNNDTHVTPGWIATLTRHFQRSAELGLLGPVTNNIGNEARIDIRYDTMDEMRTAAAEFTTRHAGQRTPLCTAAFFCVMLRRSVYEKVGPLDEAFGIGFFEDDDYCRRVEQAGWTIACADDVFVHHQLSASFDKMKQETRQALFEKNRAIYESKWGAWVPHKYRDA